MAGSKRKSYECLGGPLCGSRLAQGPRICYEDKEGARHYYRLVRVLTDDRKFLATYYHYFGTSLRRAERCPPCMVPGEKAFKAVTR